MKKTQRDDEVERLEDAPTVAEPESFGTWLRRQREVREIDLREIADSSKVSMSYLRALEEDRFDVLPAPVFAKGFLRQYARYVGLDPEEVVNFYLAARSPEGEEQPALEPRLAAEPPSRNYLWVALATVVILVLLVWLLSFLSERARTETPPADSSAPVPVSPPSAAPDASAAAGSTAETPAEPEPAVDEPAADPRVPLLVTLDFMSDCWVEASIDGNEKISELKVQGESMLLEAEELVEFKVGNVDAVQVEVNGHPFAIEDRKGTSVRRVRIDLETAAALAAGATAPGTRAETGGVDG